MTETEQAILVRLAVFPGSFSQSAAEAVAGASLWSLTTLVDCSMIRQDENQRYSLHPLLAQYLTELLADSPDSLAETQAHHACHYYEWLNNQALPILRGESLPEISLEFGNLRQAWYWLVDNDKVAELNSIYIFYSEIIFANSQILTAEEIFGYAKNHFEAHAEDKQVAKLLSGIVLFFTDAQSNLYGYTPENHQQIQHAYKYALYSADPMSIVVTGLLVEDKDESIYNKNLALLEQLSPTPLDIYALNGGYIALARDRMKHSYHDALALSRKALQLSQKFDYTLLTIRNHMVTAYVEMHYKYWDKAEQHFLTALSLSQENQHLKHMYECSWGLRLIYILIQRHTEARYHNELCLDYCRSNNNHRGIRQYYQFSAIIARQAGDIKQSIADFEQALIYMQSYPALHDDFANTHSELAWTYFLDQNYDLGQQHLAHALAHMQAVWVHHYGNWVLGFLGGIRAEIILNHGILALHEGNFTQAVAWLAVAYHWATAQDNTFLLRKLDQTLTWFEPHFPERNIIDLLESTTDLGLEEAFNQLINPLESVPQPLIENISERELDVLALLTTGATNRDIAHELFITLGTVKRHIHNIMGKLGVENRTQAALKAKELGLA